MGTDLTTPKGDKNASEGDAAIAGATRAAVRKLGQELGIPADQLPLEDFSFLTKVCCAWRRVCVCTFVVACAPLSMWYCPSCLGGGGERFRIVLRLAPLSGPFCFSWRAKLQFHALYAA